MEPRLKKAEFYYVSIGAVLGWFSVVLQFILSLENRKASTPETIIRFFSYFTILTNILAAICYTSTLRSRNNFFSRPKVLTAAAVYITVVGLIYNLILRYIWDPQGLQFFADEALHLVNPILFILFWVLFVPKSGLNWTEVFPWLIYPFTYIVYVLVRGEFSGFYPYPFINVSELGFTVVIKNCLLITLVFVVLSLMYIGIGKIKKYAK